MDQYGHGRGTMHGGFCEFSLVKAKYCYVIKTDITADEAALLEPMGEFSIKVKPWITPDKEKKFSGWMIWTKITEHSDKLIVQYLPR
jgi:hypothetical protein